MKDQSEGHNMVDVRLARIVVRDGEDQQWIYLVERDGQRGFPIVIGSHEAAEIQRVVTQQHPHRPLTHQLAYAMLEALDTKLVRVDIVDLRENTYYAQVVLHQAKSELTAVVDSRPSDALALALRAGCPIRVAESILAEARTDKSGPDPLPDEP